MQTMQTLRTLMLLAAAVPVFGKPVSFNVPQRDFTLPIFPAAVATGDFNGDGKLDVVATQAGSTAVAVLLGKGNGTFQPPINVPGGDNANAVAVGDFNGDGKLDVAVANQTGNTITVLLGKGDGTFQAGVNYAVPNGPSGIGVADFNHDGNLDLVTLATSGNNGYVVLLLGKGDGTFGAATQFEVDGGPASLVVGDFNHDGNQDVAVANNPVRSSGEISVLLGDGKGSFAPYVLSYAGPELTTIAAGDLNGDGNLDLVVSEESNNPKLVTVLLGNGDGTFQPPVAQNFTGTVYRIADMNHDGKLDLVGAGTGSTVLVLLGNGDGTFQSSPTSTATAQGPVGLALGKFASGGKGPDVVTGNFDAPSISILLNKGNGTFRTPVAVNVPRPAGIAAADFNHDGNIDLATADQSTGKVAILLGKGDGTFQHYVNYPAGQVPSELAVGDFNADGNPDLAAIDLSSNSIQILLGKGDGSFGRPMSVSVGVNVGFSLATADFNGDGKLDLVITLNSGNNVVLFLGNGDGTFQAGKNIGVGFPANFAATADFNHDGKADLAVGGSSSLSVLLGNGDGTFKAGPVYPIALTFAYNPGIGDLNGDGNLDLVVPGMTTLATGGLVTLLGNGDGTFQAPTTYYFGSRQLSVVLADFNGDGKLDVASVNNLGNDVAVALGNGDGTLGAPVFYPAGFVTSIVTADFNNDHKPDLVYNSTNEVLVLTNTTK